MSGRRPRPIIVAALVLAVAVASGLSWPRCAGCQEAEVIRGTVEKFRPGILSLNDVKLPNGGSPGRAVMVIVNKDTEYFNGTVRTAKESITTGALVLVKCKPAGGGRLAVLVRIIGGKAP